MRRQLHAADLSDALRIDEKDLGRVSASTIDQRAEPGEGNRQSDTHDISPFDDESELRPPMQIMAAQLDG